MWRSSCVSTWASREAGTSQNEWATWYAAPRGAAFGNARYGTPCVSSSHAPWWHISRWEGHASWFRGHAARWLPHGSVMLNLPPPPPSMPPPNKPALWEKIQDSRSGSCYYWEHASGVSAWQEPQTFAGYWKRIFDEYRMLITAGTRRRTNLATTSRLRRRRRRCRQRRSHPLQCQGRPETLDFRNVHLVISLERLTTRCHLKMLLSRPKKQ